MEMYSEKEFLEQEKEFLHYFEATIVAEDSTNYYNPRLGEIWICKIPVIVVKENVYFKTMRRPILVIDDTEGHFVKNDLKNYYGLKITSQEDTYERIKIKESNKTGLQKKSFVRIELPLKIEKEQFLYRIGVYNLNEVKKITNKVMKKLQKIAK